MILNFIKLSKMEDDKIRTVIEDSGEYILIPIDKEVEGTIIWLHGLGGKGKDNVTLFLSKLCPFPQSFRVRLLTAPEAPVTINLWRKTNSWFDIKNRQYTEDTLGMEEVRSNAARINKVIEEEIKINGEDPKKVFIGGFSQGCAMSLYCGLQYPEELGGIIGISGFAFSSIEVKKDMDMRILISHGMEDPVIKFDIASKTYENIGLVGLEKFMFVKIPKSGHCMKLPVFKSILEYFKLFGYNKDFKFF